MSNTTINLKLTDTEIADLVFALIYAEAKHPKCFESIDVENLADKLRAARRELESTPLE